ncbi:MAG: hypothetical protein LHW60_00550 [Candidatus Cloacimonetes bacterium]|nr:hypothetical protein [Candidatus Cloacimonadota bacterium]
MKNIILLIIASLILSSCFMGSSLLFMESEIQDKPNLVLNPSFDAYSFAGTDALRGWTIYTKPDDSEFNKIRIDPMQSIDGDTSLRIDASNKDVVIISDSFDVRRYGGYYSRIRFKTDSPQPPQARLRLTAFKGNGKITNRFSKKMKLGQEWNTTSISAGFLKPGAKFGRVSIEIPAFKEGSVWIDDTGCWEVHGFRID